MENHTNTTYRDGIKLVVFDWAGTVVDYGCQAPVGAFIAGFRAKGVVVSRATARIPMGMEKRDHIKTVASYKEVAQAWRGIHGRDVTENDIDSMYDNFASLLLGNIEEHSKLLPGVYDAVAALRKNGVKIAASTGYFTQAADIVVKAAAKEGYRPDFTICSSDVPAGRPYPWMIYRSMEALGVYPPGAVVNVGDTPVDMATSLNAGVWSVGVAATGNQVGLAEDEVKGLDPEAYKKCLYKAHKSLLTAGAHYVIDSMAQFPAIVQKINARLVRGENP
ncbi:MAG: phosphonoacetaldehyde hydrolase [Desulfobacterales bacterium]|nr:phosphonoacetaldehyde hydrolase [Desulfobacterales bacterium]